MALWFSVAMAMLGSLDLGSWSHLDSHHYYFLDSGVS